MNPGMNPSPPGRGAGVRELAENSSPSCPLLRVTNLEVQFPGPHGPHPAVDDLNFDLDNAGTLAIVGESGSGKTQAALALIGLNPANAGLRGSVRYEGREWLGSTEDDWNRLRGDRVGFVFQDPMTALNPYLTVGEQMAEVLIVHRGVGRAAALAESARMLDACRIPDAAARLRCFPHEFSGGMRQRVLIAAALLTRPRLLIADEPTTALDVTVQAQILRLLDELRRSFGMALLLITHDLGIVGEACERVLVMYAGRAVESGPTAAVLARPQHPYTRGLLRARPSLHAPTGLLEPIPGQPPSVRPRTAGCAFAPRCPFALQQCALQKPEFITNGNRARACFAPAEPG